MSPINERKLQRVRAKLLFEKGESEEARKALRIAKGITPRPKMAEASMIDLSDYYTTGLIPISGSERGRRNSRRRIRIPNLNVEPGILNSSQGTRFDVRGIVSPTNDSNQSPARRPLEAAQAKTIPVGSRALRIHFLHSAMLPPDSNNDTSPSTLGEYVITLGDGSQTVVPIRTGENIGDWQSAPAENHPAIAWSHPSQEGFLFQATWESPGDEAAEIRSIALRGRREGSGHHFSWQSPWKTRDQ